MRDLSQLPDLALALIQTELAWHDPAANRAHFQVLLQQARGADLIVLPEMFSTGFSMESAALAEPEDGPTSQWLLEQAQALQAVITGSLITSKQVKPGDRVEFTLEGFGAAELLVE